MPEHHHHHDLSGKNLFLAIVLNVIITLAQIIGGVLSGSMALLSDAVHNFSDVMALVIAYGANRIAKRPRSEQKTFGYRRVEILAALFNAAVLIGIAIFLIVESAEKFLHPETIDSFWVITLGLLSIVLNALSVWLVKSDAHTNMNVKAVYLHLLTDVMTSVAVVVGGVLMYYYQLFWVDPLISILIALYLIGASLSLLKSSAAVLMQFAPAGLETDEIARTIEAIPEIAGVHHLHLWQLDDHRIHLEAHLDFHEDITLQACSQIIDNLERALHKRFGITHTTFQCEHNRCDDKRLIR
jgi:cobalt-zinc-cadmium efflux system protein